MEDNKIITVKGLEKVPAPIPNICEEYFELISIRTLMPGYENVESKSREYLTDVLENTHEAKRLKAIKEAEEKLRSAQQYHIGINEAAKRLEETKRPLTPEQEQEDIQETERAENAYKEAKETNRIFKRNTIKKYQKVISEVITTALTSNSLEAAICREIYREFYEWPEITKMNKENAAHTAGIKFDGKTLVTEDNNGPVILAAPDLLPQDLNTDFKAVRTIIEDARIKDTQKVYFDPKEKERLLEILKKSFDILGKTIPSDTEEKTPPMDLQRVNNMLGSLIGLRPYTLSGARQIVEVVKNINKTFPKGIKDNIYYVEIEVKTKVLPTPYGAEAPEKTVIACKALEQIIKSDLTEIATGVLLEMVATAKIIDNGLTVDENGVIKAEENINKYYTYSSLTESDISTLSRVLFGESNNTQRQRLFKGIETLSKPAPFTFTDGVSRRPTVSNDGFIKTRIRYDAETGKFARVDLIISPIFQLLLKQKYATIDLIKYRRLRQKAGGKFATPIILRSLANGPRISQERKKGAYTMVINFEDVFPTNGSESGRTAYYKNIDKAAKLSDEIADVTGAAKVEVIRKTGKRSTPTGLRVTFSHERVNIESPDDIAGKITYMAKDIETIKANTKPRRGRPRKKQ